MRQGAHRTRVVIALLVPTLLVAIPPALGATSIWNTNSTISGESDSGRPDFAMSADGSRMLAVWDESGSVRAKMASVSINGSMSWTATLTLGGTAYTYPVTYPLAYSPQVALSADGTTAIVSWLRQEGENSYSFVAKTAALTSNSITWGATTVLSATKSINPGWSRVAISANGSMATAVWNFDWNELATRSAAVTGTSASWGETSVLATNGGTPELTLSSTGTTAVAVWTTSNPNVVHSSTASISGSKASWSSGAAVLDGMWPKIRMSTDGSRVVVMSWDWSDGWVMRLRAGAFSKGAIGWGSSSVQRIGAESVWPQISLSANGMVAATIWENQGSGIIESRQALISYTKTGGIFTWGGTQSVSDIQQGRSIYPKIALSGDGIHVLATWYQNIGAASGENWLYFGQSSVKVAKATITKGIAVWEMPTELFAGGLGGYLKFEQTKPLLSYDGSRRAAIWTGRENSVDKVLGSNYVYGAKASKR